MRIRILFVPYVVYRSNHGSVAILVRHRASCRVFCGKAKMGNSLSFFYKNVVYLQHEHTGTSAGVPVCRRICAYPAVLQVVRGFCIWRSCRP